MASTTVDKTRESMQEARDKAGEAGEAVMNRAREVGENVANRAREAGETAYNRAREVGESAYNRARDVYDHAGDYVQPYRRSFEDSITSNPVKAVGVALLVGVCIGWLIKRS